MIRLLGIEVVIFIVTLFLFTKLDRDTSQVIVEEQELASVATVAD